MITFENFDEFVKNYANKERTCIHNFPSEFEEIGDLIDNSLIPLSYLDFKSENESEIFIGSYPYNSAKIWKCRKCGSITLSYTDDCGWGRLTKLGIDFSKNYLTEPANKSVCIRKSNIKEFTKLFNIEINLSAETSNSYVGTKLIDKSKISIFNPRIESINNIENIRFEIIGNREFLRKIADYQRMHK